MTTNTSSSFTSSARWIVLKHVTNMTCKLPPIDRLIAVVIADHMDLKTQTCFVGIKGIRNRTGLGHTRVVEGSKRLCSGPNPVFSRIPRPKGRGYIYGLDPSTLESPSNPSPRKKKKSMRRRRNFSPLKHAWSILFEEDFWPDYPIHDAKNAALQAWEKLCPDTTEKADELLEAIKAVLAERKGKRWKRREKAMIPNGASFLRTEAFLDAATEIEEANKGYTGGVFANRPLTPEEKAQRRG